MGNEKFPNVFIDRFLSNDFCHLYNQSRDLSGNGKDPLQVGKTTNKDLNKSNSHIYYWNKIKDIQSLLQNLGEA